MAEKNTLSILETIKRKMHKLDQKTDKSSKISNLNDEFEYISSAPKQEAPQPVDAKAPESVPAAKPEDDLDLDALEEAVQASEKAPVKPASKEHVLDDFNLDDLDLDDEAPAVQTPNKEVKSEEISEEEFAEDEIEDYEDEIDFDEEGESEAMAEIEDNTLSIENEEEGGLDWLGNKVEGESEGETEDDLEFPEEAEAIEHIEEEQEVEEDHDDDLNLDDLDLSEENISAPRESRLSEQSSEDDNLDFDDLDFEEEVKEEKKLPEFDLSASEAKTQNQPKNSKDIEDFLEKKPALKEPISLEDEIDFEFEKEIMGLRPEVTQKDERPANQAPEIFQQPISQQSFMPPQDNVSTMNQSGLVTSSERGQTKIIYDSTLRQTSDSIKKLLDAKNMVSGVANFSQSSSFAELAMQLMEPKMEKWLNEHLPDLVEKIVREEIKRIIRKE